MQASYLLHGMVVSIMSTLPTIPQALGWQKFIIASSVTHYAPYLELLLQLFRKGFLLCCSQRLDLFLELNERSILCHHLTVQQLAMECLDSVCVIKQHLVGTLNPQATLFCSHLGFMPIQLQSQTGQQHTTS